MNRLFLLMLCAGHCVSYAADKPSAVMPARHLALLERYCLDCHDSDTRKGQVNLENLSWDLGSDPQVAERWQEVLNVLNAGEMPPKDKRQLTPTEKTAFLSDLSQKLVIARKVHGDSAGVITMRRLNQREYANTIEALLGVRPNVDGLPDDSAGSGFDTAGASLYFSSDQFEQYVEIARAALDLALTKEIGVPKKVIRLEAERGGLSKEGYAKRLEKYRDDIERAQAFLAKPDALPKDFGFPSAKHARVGSAAAKRMVPILESYLARPEISDGTIMMALLGRGAFSIRTPEMHPEPNETFTIRLRAGIYPDVPSRFHYLEIAALNIADNSYRTLGWRKVRALQNRPEIIEFPAMTIPGERTAFVIRQRSHPKGSKNDGGIYRAKGMLHTPPGIWLDWIEVERSGRPAGPTPETANLFFPKPNGWSEERYARKVFQRFANRAFRTAQPSDEYLGKLVDLFTANRAKGQKLREALLQPLSIVLASPTFLYMVESTGNERLTNPELAVRLSYFLWSAPPDDELMAAAKAGRLSDPDVLQQQTTRLLADPKADRFIRDFAYQWLGMDRLGMFAFDTLRYPEHDVAVLQGSRDEIYQTIRHFLDHQLPLRTLLKSDFVVVNDIMAEYYGLPDVVGHEYRKVSLPADSPRGGLLGTAAVLAMGSDGKRTSPVERGAWVLRHLLHDPPPPAPPNVPQLDRLADEVRSVRQMQIAHQEEPQCVQCHRKIDPIGYGMEHFDAAGNWRTAEVVYYGRGNRQTKTFPIDSSGALMDGTKFSGFFDLRDAIAARTDDFARGVVESIIAYGLGRPYGFSDHDLSETLLEKSKPSGYALDQIIHALIQTDTFQSK